MTNKQFSEFFLNAVAMCRRTLDGKQVEYAKDDNRFYNFIRAGEGKRETPEKALWGMFYKHLVSLSDIIDAVESGDDVPENIYNEKLKDSINYLFLLWGMLAERKTIYPLDSRSDL